MVNNKFTEIIKKCEKDGKFNEEITNITLVNPDQKRKYLYNDFFSRLFYYFVRCLVVVLSPLLGFFWCRLKVEGKKNLKQAKKVGGISVSNHVFIVDNLFIKNLIFKEIYCLGGVQNNKKGVAGYMLNALGNLPLSTDLSSKKKLDGVIAQLLDKKHFVHVCPEATMWIGYDKIRPFFNGAFHYAVKNNKPVLPIVFMFRQPTKWDKFVGRKYCLTQRVLPLIYPDQSLPFKQSVINLNQSVRQAIIDNANDFYGYETDVTKIDFSAFYKDDASKNNDDIPLAQTTEFCQNSQDNQAL